MESPDLVIKFVLATVAVTVLAVIVGRLLFGVQDWLARRKVDGWTLVGVRTNLDVSAPTIQAQRKRLIPLATEIWENPKTGERKTIAQFWP